MSHAQRAAQPAQRSQIRSTGQPTKPLCALPIKQ
jgi:hypothetical protein